MKIRFPQQTPYIYGYYRTLEWFQKMATGMVWQTISHPMYFYTGCP